MYFCHKLMEIYLNMGNVDFLANVRMLKFGSELRFGIRSPNVRTSVDIPSYNLVNGPFWNMANVSEDKIQYSRFLLKFKSLKRNRTQSLLSQTADKGSLKWSENQIGWYEPRHEKTCPGFPTKPDTNQSVQSQNKIRSLRLRI